MIKILLIMSFLGLVAGDEFTDKLNEKLGGDWTPVKIFPPTPIKKNADCYATNNTISDDYCKCAGKLVPQLIRANAQSSNQLPIIMVENDQELQEGYNATCLCKERDETSEHYNEFVPFPTHMMIRIINDNYFMAYDKDYRDRKPSAFALLLAKDVPTTAELEKFISTIDYIKNEEGNVFCTKDFQTKPEDKQADLSAEYKNKLKILTEEFEKLEITIDSILSQKN